MAVPAKKIGFSLAGKTSAVLVKSPFERKREEDEAKRAKDAADAAAALRHFESEFGGDGRSRAPAFVRSTDSAAYVNPAAGAAPPLVATVSQSAPPGAATGAWVGSAGAVHSLFVPPPPPKPPGWAPQPTQAPSALGGGASMAGSTAGASRFGRSTGAALTVSGAFGSGADGVGDETVMTSSKRLFSGVKKQSNLESMKEQMKRQQESRDSSGRRPSSALAPVVPVEPKGSFDDGDPNTTNLYVGNLSGQISELILCELFGPFGPLGSVKIMWPRSEEEKARGRLCGFVSFMERRHAETALHTLANKLILGSEMRLSWGKAVALPPAPFYVSPLAPPPSIETDLPFGAQPRAGGEPTLANLARTDVHVVVPKDRALRVLIHRMVEHVVLHGPEFEMRAMQRAPQDTKYDFLFDHRCPAHVYYRWKLFSVLQGDDLHNWSTREFRMFNKGSVWHPPRTLDSDAAKGHLSTSQRDQLEAQLHRLGPDRASVAECMLHCVGLADAAEEVVACVEESLVVADAAGLGKVARLYLVSDILHNSSTRSVRHASNFRTSFETKLRQIFEHLNITYREIAGRLRAEQFRRRVMNCLMVWRDWSIYPPDVLAQLETLFTALPPSQSAPLAPPPLLPAACSVPTNDNDDDDVDGVPLGHQAAPVGDHRDAFSAVSAAVDDDDDVDGVPMGENSVVEPPRKLARV